MPFSSHGFDAGIDFGQGAGVCFAESEKVAVVVDEYRYAETLPQEGTESHAVAERGKVRQIASYDSRTVVGRSGEGETYCHRGTVKTGDYFFEAAHHGGEAAVEVVGVRGVCYRLHDEFASAHGAENEVGAAGIEGNDCPVVVFIHGIVFLQS